MELAEVTVQTRVDCSATRPPAASGGCALAGESERTYRRRRLLYFQAHFSSQQATPGAGAGTQSLVFADDDVLDHIHFSPPDTPATPATLDICGLPDFGGTVELRRSTSNLDFRQLCPPADPTVQTAWEAGIDIDRVLGLRTTTVNGSRCPATAGVAPAWLEGAERVSERAGGKWDGAVVDLSAAADGDVYYADQKITVWGLNRAGASVTVASPAGIVVDLASSPVMGTGLPDVGSAGALSVESRSLGASTLVHPVGGVALAAGESAYFKLELSQPWRTRFALLRLSGTTDDADLFLLDENGAVVASSDTGGPGVDEWLGSGPIHLLAGTYYLRVDAITDITNTYAIRHDQRRALTDAEVTALNATGFADRHTTANPPVVALVTACDVEVVGPAAVGHVPLYTPCPEPLPNPAPSPMPADWPLWSECSDPPPAVRRPASESVIPTLVGAPPENDHALAGTAAYSALQTALADLPAALRLEMRNVAVFAPFGGLYAADHDTPVGNCALPSPLRSYPATSGEAEEFTTAVDYMPCSEPVLRISGSLITQYRMLVGEQLPSGTGTRHLGGFIKDFTYPEGFWLAVPPWWPQSRGEFWYPL
ncbi:PPC domain-containing protein [Candidatus Poriferisocius sp.]|uniref:PPC domain-containing protein n=1 Tax=Candidatus Poriferisocius sp. TaxID=3101276 RepID=UPI003B01B199